MAIIANALSLHAYSRLAKKYATPDDKDKDVFAMLARPFALGGGWFECWVQDCHRVTILPLSALLTHLIATGGDDDHGLDDDGDDDHDHGDGGHGDDDHSDSDEDDVDDSWWC